MDYTIIINGIIFKKKENEKLFNQTEKIKSSYSKELEELKKEHRLDITRGNNTKNQENLIPILDEFNRPYLNDASQNT